MNQCRTVCFTGIIMKNEIGQAYNYIIMFVLMQRRRRLWARWARAPPLFIPKCPPPTFYGHVAVTGHIRNCIRRPTILQHSEARTVVFILVQMFIHNYLTAKLYCKIFLVA